MDNPKGQKFVPIKEIYFIPETKAVEKFSKVNRGQKY